MSHTIDTRATRRCFGHQYGEQKKPIVWGFAACDPSLLVGGTSVICPPAARNQDNVMWQVSTQTIVAAVAVSVSSTLASRLSC